MSVSLSTPRTIQGAAAGRRTQLAVAIGHEPALDPTGQQDPHERQALNVRWLAGTVLTGVGGGSLLVAALVLSLDSATVAPERAERSTPTAAAGGPQAGGAHKGDKLVRAVDAVGAKQSYRSPMTLKVADREVIKVRNFVRVATTLSTVSGALASEVPAFNATKLMTQDTTSERAPEPAAETGDADVSFVKTDLSAAPADRLGAQALTDADVIAQVAEERRAIRDSGRRPYLPLPAQTLLMRTLRTGLPTPEETTPYSPSPVSSPFSNIEVRVVPENVTNLNKREAEQSDTQSDERATLVRRGETIEAILRAHGASPEEVRLIIAALSKGARNYAVAEGRTVKLLLTPARSGRVQILRVSILDGEQIESMAAINDDFAYVNVSPQDSTPKQTRPKNNDEDDEEDDGTGLRFYNAFYETALRQQIPREIIDELVRVFSNDVDMQKRASPSDSFEAFFTDDDNELDLLNASITVGGETYRYYRYANPEENFADYYNEQGKSARKFLMRKPIADGVFRSPFGMRYHPILRYSRPHNGVDWANKIGTPILAAGNGTVISAGWSSGYGKHTEIQHANGYVTTYSHQSSFAPGIAEGAKVRQGQVIGYVGTTGLSTGPHLHYEVVVNGSYVDPMKIKVPRGRELDGKSLADFQKYREQIDSLMQKAPGNGPKLAQATR